MLPPTASARQREAITGIEGILSTGGASTNDALTCEYLGRQLLGIH